MTILFFSRLFYPHIGGVETHVMEISKHLIKDGHKVIMITEALHIPRSPGGNPAGYPPGELVRKNNLSSIEVYRITVGNNEKQKKWLIWKWLWKHRDLIQKADIVHCHDVFFWYLPFRLLYPFKPVYTTFHGYEAGASQPTNKAIFIRKISEWLSWGNICVGKFIEKWYGTRANYIIYGGIRILPIHTYTANKKIKIAFVGRLDADTGGSIYLEALKILKQKKIPFTFETYGDGVMRQDFEKYGKVFGFIENVPEKILQSDIIFASSYLSILEALYLKKPVFAVYQNLLKKDYLEITPFRNWLWIGTDPKLLAKSLKTFRFSNSAYEWAKKQTWENVVNIYYLLWKRHSADNQH